MHEIFKVSGVVMRGDGRGNALGFPTANIRLHKKIPEGIYAGIVKFNGRIYHAAVFVGSARTFQKTDVKVECYIFDFSKDIYRRWITVKLYKKIRENKRFETVEALVEQMKMDVGRIREYFDL
jgi:riboflavin kinase / FMN adenylyltransferase